MKETFDFVEQETGIDLKKIQNSVRTEECVSARKIFVFLARSEGFSYSKIGRQLGRDHTSVMHSMDVILNNGELKKTMENTLVRFNEYKKNINDAEGEKSKPIVFKNVGILGKYRWLHEKQGGKCTVCGFDEIVEVHHIIARYLGGTEDPENLILLCPNHHALADRGMLFINSLEIKKDVDNVHLSTYPQS